MSKKILSFSHRLSVSDAQCANVNPGCKFLRLNVDDDTYVHAGFFKGAVFIAQADKLIERYLHYAETDEHGVLARVTDINEATIYVTPLDRDTPAKLVPRTDLGFVGAIVEMYPSGLTGARWILGPNEIEAQPSHEPASVISFPRDLKAGLAAFRKDVGMMRWQTDGLGYHIPSDEMRMWIALLGCDPEAWAGWGWIDFLHPDDRNPYLFRWSESIDTGKPYLNQGRICIQGMWLYMVVSANPVRGGSGEIVRWEGFLHFEAIEERLTA